jgi:hypothetical protein
MTTEISRRIGARKENLISLVIALGNEEVEVYVGCFITFLGVVESKGPGRTLAYATLPLFPLNT